MASNAIDRDEVSPFLLRLFYKTGRHNSADDFHPFDTNLPSVEIYTWLSASLDELSYLVAEELSQILPEPAIGTRLDFEIVYADARGAQRNDSYGAFQKRPLGSVVLKSDVDDHEPRNRRPNDMAGDEGKTLADVNFVIGDFIDCAIYPPLANGEVAAPPRSLTGRVGPPPRENGYMSQPLSGRRGGPGGSGGGVPPGEWRRGDVVPPAASGFRRRGGRGRAW